jgi:hypothetical protein
LGADGWGFAVWAHNAKKCVTEQKPASDVKDKLSDDAKGSVRSEHYSHSSTGTRLHRDAQAYRAAHPDGANPHRNFATADVTIDGIQTTVRFKNDPGGMHSEQRLVAWVEAMTTRG